MSCELLSGLLSCPGILLQLTAMGMFFISPLGTRFLPLPAPLATLSLSARIFPHLHAKPSLDLHYSCSQVD